MPDFIEVYEDIYTSEFCENLIEFYKFNQSVSKTWRRNDTKLTQDESIVIEPRFCDETVFTWDSMGAHLEDFNETLNDTYMKKYCQKYPTLLNLQDQMIYTYKIQETQPSQGYHFWHSEVDGLNFCRRIMAYAVFLNDIEEGGELEFLYQSRRISPKQGSLVLWPATWPHAHRGNPPLKETKYLLTGWIEFSK